tara:strand:- start:1072 stop:1524 length:453 start_codon:yes stop_codon:yes gene_type:complete
MILKLFKKNKHNLETSDNLDIIKITSLLIHAAKIDENYTDKEKKIIRQFILTYSKEKIENLDEKKILDIFKKSEENEKNSNQILEFTKEVKTKDINLKKLVLKTLWEIVLSDNKSGIYESNLIRRICGLLYLPDKLSGEIKSSILENKKK